MAELKQAAVRTRRSSSFRTSGNCTSTAAAGTSVVGTPILPRHILTPIPTTACKRCARLRTSSQRMPAALPLPIQRSLGHLSLTSGLSFQRDSAQAAPTTGDSPERSPSETESGTPTVKRTDAAGAVQRRPRVPRPAVCRSVTKATAISSSAFLTHSLTSSLVLAVSSTQCASRQL